MSVSLDDVPPIIVGSTLSGDEAARATHLVVLLAQLSGYVSDFESALALFDYSEGQLRSGNHVAGRWMLTASRDAAMTRYHFNVIVNAINGGIGLCPTLLPHLDKPRMKLAMGLLGSHSGKDERLRHAVGHAADAMKSKEKLAANRGPDGPYITPNVKLPNLANVFIGGDLDGRQFMATRIDHQGRQELLKLQMSAITLEEMRRIQRLVFAALRPIEKAVLAQLLAS